MNNAKVIADELLNNKAAIIETDTVMGVISKNADLIYKIKKRSLNKRVILFVSNFSSIKNLTKKEKIVLKKY
jgi:tRNA A37 threonylcarbamoyladenosine synthetase subunit TsaC/SUA5/YrdC